MMRHRFDLVVFGQDVNDVLRFAQGLVIASRCPSFALAALLIEASELAILSCKDQWPFTSDKDVAFDELRTGAKVSALEVYHNGDNDNANS